LKAGGKLILKKSKFISFAQVAILYALAVVCSVALAQGMQSTAAQAKVLAEAHAWQRVVELLEPVQKRSADEQYWYGSALAHMDRWEEAGAAFAAGGRMAPRDARFPEERAGVAFHEKRYAAAAKLLRRVLRLNPEDTYAKDFLATVYYLEGNLPAALKYWNMVGKPQIAAVRQDPPLKVDAALLDRAFVFAPESELHLRDFLNTQTRLDGLGIFPYYSLGLEARQDGRFDAALRARETNGFGMSHWQTLAMIAVGLPFQSVHLDGTNLRHRAINLKSMYRWDAQKRRVQAELSMPFERRAAYRLNVGLDLRGENWVVRDSFTGPAPSLGSMNMRREALSFDLASHAAEKLEWRAGAEVSHRDFRSVVDGSALTTDLLAKGYALKQMTRVESVVWRVPERRFKVDAAGESDAGRVWSAGGEAFEKLSGTIAWHWYPQAHGGDYEMSHQVRGGKTFGKIPFDELYMLGLERDNDLPMRAHIGSRGGKKGSAPLGRDYLLSNFDFRKDIYNNGLVALQAGPFVDIGAIDDPAPALGSHQWLYDVGGEARVRAFGYGIGISYGTDVHNGNHAFYVTLLPAGRETK
jgi:tetratricopeptide (TPR) repeat protein